MASFMSNDARHVVIQYEARLWLRELREQHPSKYKVFIENLLDEDDEGTEFLNWSDENIRELAELIGKQFQP